MPSASEGAIYDVFEQRQIEPQREGNTWRIDVDLRTLASDVETPDAGLRFMLGTATNGSVTLLADGYTARFAPVADYSGPASFDYTVTDATSDDRTVFNYDFQASDATDVSGRGRDGTIHLQGTGTATFTADLPAALTPHHTQSLRLTENGTAGAARVERVMAAEDLNVATDNWTITGWFNRSTTINMDVILQIGESGGLWVMPVWLGSFVDFFVALFLCFFVLNFL
mgnify:CR=1 FL=1